MLRYIGKRILMMIPIILGITVLIFTLMYFCPGDPAQVVAGQGARPEDIDALRETMGLNRPYIIQLLDYMQKLFLHFDFGTSYITGLSVADQIMQRFPYTFFTAIASQILMIVVGIPLGVIAATNQYSWKDNVSMFLALIFTSVPGFWLASLLSLLFCVKLKILPTTANVHHLESFILPIVANAVGGITIMARQTRSSMLEVIRADYVITARAKGQKEKLVIWKHAFRNALIPLIAVTGNHFGLLMGGALVIEVVFNIPGIGTFILNSITNRDYSCIQGAVIFVSVLFSLIMLLVDIGYAFADPRIKAQFVNSAKRKAKIDRPAVVKEA